MSASSKAQKMVNEAWPLLRMWFFAQRAKLLPQDESLAFCYDVLNRVSRSFAIVIQQLPTRLRDSVCVFYLVLRALDTVEDDMSIPIKTKVPLLHIFYRKLHDRDWSLECGTKEYARLMKQYPRVTHVFLSLPPTHQQVIEEITRDMGRGMAEFIERDVVSVADYDLYCHYVAGLVGIGLSKLFSASGLESPAIAKMEALSNGMGLFLQKTNIIRDYLEDIMEEPAPRMFWPKEIWGQYARDLSEFKAPSKSEDAVRALNHMVTDALRHATQSLQYMMHLRDTDVYRFCAIPQVMAIATLAEIYNNPRVFTGVVKVRRGVVARYMVGLNNQTDLLRAFLHFSNIIEKRCRSEAAHDPSAKVTLDRAQDIAAQASKELQDRGAALTARPDWMAYAFRMALLLAAAAAFLRINSAPLLSILVTAPCLFVSTLLVYSSAQRV